MRNGWNPRVIRDLLKGRAIDTQYSMDSTKRLISGNPAFEFMYDFYLAQFYILNDLWMKERYLVNRASLIDRLRTMLESPMDPSEDACDPGRFTTYWELQIKALIDEFESLIYR